jgi:arsenite-transporting ATPase
MLVLVSRADDASLAEAERTHRELDSLGVRRQELVLNGLFSARGSDDPVAQAFEAVARAAVARAPSGVASLPRTELPLFPYELVGIPALRTLLGTQHLQPLESAASHGAEQMGPSFEGLDALVPDIAALGHGAVMTMGKGGVGKTSVAVAVATMLAERGHRVHLTTTDPAGHAFEVSTPNLRVSRIDPAAETAAYRESVLATASSSLDEAGRALLEEDLRSPCTEEVAVFRAFARTIEQGEQGFVVIDTAPTGHTLLLLDAAETYHREVLRTAGETTDDVRRLLPRLRDAHFTHILIVTLPEATPVHEAASLQRDLARADIHPFAWVVNQSLSPLVVSEPVLSARRAGERRYLNEVRGLAQRIALVPWIAALTQQPIGDQSKGSPAVAPEAHQQQ